MSCGFGVWQESTSPSIQAHVSYLFQEELPDLCCQQHPSHGAPPSLGGCLSCPDTVEVGKSSSLRRELGLQSQTEGRGFRVTWGRHHTSWSFSFFTFKTEVLNSPLENKWVCMARSVPSAWRCPGTISLVCYCLSRFWSQWHFSLTIKVIPVLYRMFEKDTHV